MGRSSNGIICYGIECEEGVGFPWDGDGIEYWWAFTVNADKFNPAVESPYDANGEYLPRFRPKTRFSTSDHPEVKAYHRERIAHLEASGAPPVEIVKCGSLESPMYVIAVIGSVIECSGDHRTVFDPAKLTVDAGKVADLMNFCADYEIGVLEGVDEGWVLCSYTE